MKSLLLSILFLALALAGKVSLSQTTCNCGWTNSGRIVGGKATKRNEYPWMAALSSRGKFFCGGSIISPYHVLTAAHCGEIVPADILEIIIGAYDINDVTQTVPVAKIVIHEKWDTSSKASNFDISIIVTAQQILFSKFIGPVCMPHIPLKLDNQYIKVMGWGRTADQGSSSNILLEVDLKVLPRSQCTNYWSSLDNKICAIGVKKDSCNGDSGGPLVWLDHSTNKYTQAALVSDGGECGGPKPSVNTDVSAYISWINRVIDTTKPGVNVCTASGVIGNIKDDSNTLKGDSDEYNDYYWEWKE